MFIKNVSPYCQNFTLCNRVFRMNPGQTAIVTEEQMEDDIFKILKAKGVLEIEGEGEVIGKIAKEVKAEVIEVAEADGSEVIEEPVPVTPAQEEKPVIRVMDHKDNTAPQCKVVQCDAIKADGTHCTTKVTIAYDEYDDEVPHFCGRHRNQDPADYERINGKWEHR